MTEEYYRYLREVQYKGPANLDSRAELHRRFSRNQRGLHRWIFDHLLDNVHGSILEIGAGPAYLWTRNRDRIPDNWDIVLTDISPGMIVTARDELSAVGTNFKYLVLDGGSLPFLDECFDAVIANHMIYHIAEIPRGIAEMRRVLSPGGTLFASTNDNDHLQEIDELVHEIAPSIIFGSKDLKGIQDVPFSLSNGAEHLASSFDKVLRYRFDDELMISEVEPLVQYILSFPGNAREVFAEVEKERELRVRIKERIDQDGAFHVTKSAGMFIAS